MDVECRICLDSTNDLENRLRTPCLCKGTNLYIHERCLSQLRAMSIENYYRCPTCKFQYIIQKQQQQKQFDIFIWFILGTLIYVLVSFIISQTKKNDDWFTQLGVLMLVSGLRHKEAIVNWIV